jgi:hypothetical protein
MGDEDASPRQCANGISEAEFQTGAQELFKGCLIERNVTRITLHGHAVVRLRGVSRGAGVGLRRCQDGRSRMEWAWLSDGNVKVLRMGAQ